MILSIDESTTIASRSKVVKPIPVKPLLHAHKPAWYHHLPTVVKAPSLRSYQHCLVAARAHAEIGSRR